ncbi:hypothetical protein appser12_5570 [Actinobacillus pleuropneumoniae serovar 12 str. 1096]|uniref:Uncharacterized protein n=1 Tax=Actinobacillus pleuropneumoniae serovar 6 str. Femo TaxID=754256 RepID=A0A828PKE8_ACTPL|nr:hypothetical protein appser2_5090 [Actinobacillus pleuropneumoniae serovar 2 str. S1536]EFM90329.1 hypothetical protein appser4_5470 [Actinobacillus pleuropneumoniae serovar 4 str. M62]EFM92415.1 hypothetical protein appser6_6190 [Actinobacillus pleuropneumoniae serovar 6 str. Femo]EFM96872.1 hypothetical protein appser10_5650 [Actinobacillus pleuropneumoniae serovar 10 str. D13039]EFN01087.1 hypothetical protein appser12_5570 [Actinobacillus pleuropneumoniae serovar 12 str. 1096]
MRHCFLLSLLITENTEYAVDFATFSQNLTAYIPCMRNN